MRRPTRWPKISIATFRDFRSWRSAPSELYRIGKFIKRRPWAAVAAVALVGAATIAGVTGVREIAKTRRQRDRAERLYQSARATVQDVYYRLVEDRPSDPEDVASLNRRLLDGVSRYFDDFVAATATSPTPSPTSPRRAPGRR